MKTIFLDIDGVLFRHPGELYNAYYDTNKGDVLHGTWEKIQEWHIKGYYIVIVTTRLPSMRRITEEQLEKCRIPYHQLVMGVNRGQRVVINDMKPNSNEPMAKGISLPRDKGIGDLEI